MALFRGPGVTEEAKRLVEANDGFARGATGDGR